MTNPREKLLEIPVEGMDCAGCARTVKQAILRVPGVRSVDVLLSSEKAIVEMESSAPASANAVRRAIEQAGYAVSEKDLAKEVETKGAVLSRRVLWLFGILFGAVLLIVVAGEWLGLFESVTDRVPQWIGIGIVVLLGYPVFVQVTRATFKGRVIAHTLMTVGALAALIAGEWVTAAVVVFFMRVGDYAEHFTTERARESVRSLTRMKPQTARVEHAGQLDEIPVDQVQPGDIVLVRPGEQVPVDGIVIRGHAAINQAPITGESMPVEAVAGTKVYAATLAEGGALHIRADAIGQDTRFGRVIQMVEEAEAHRGEVQRLADRFSGYYLPVVAIVALTTYLFSQNLMATVAVLVVACSCAFALATPVAMLASIGAAAKRGLLIKGGKYLETLDKADVVLLDKTGTLTLGRPVITQVVCLNGYSENEVLHFAASAEQHAEHPVAEAVRKLANERGLQLEDARAFESIPGQGIRAQVGHHQVAVGNALLATQASQSNDGNLLEKEGKTLLFVDIDGEAAGILAAADTEREEVPSALEDLRRFRIEHIELLTGDTEQTASALAARLGLRYRAGLLPEDKIEIVRQYQARGKTVVMIGDGVNDAPALAQADVGIAMGAGGTDMAIEAAHIALLRDDWRLVPELFHVAKRTMKVVRLNIGFTALYNVIGLSLAAFGLLPPILAAAAQSLPDLGILANSACLLRQRYTATISYRPEHFVSTPVSASI